MNGQRGNGQRPVVLLCVLVMLAMLYLGYCLGAAGKPSGPEWLDAVLLRLGSPFPFAFTEWTGKFVGLCALAGAVLCMLLLSERHNFAHGKEYGTARFASPSEYNRKYRNRRKKDNKIVSKNVRISRDGCFTQRNNNCLILGGSGSGKTQFVVTPNILGPENGAGIRITKIFTDPKGEILRDNGAFLVTHGMKVVTVDLIRMKGHYNPFRYIRKSIDVIKLVTNLIANTTPKGSVKGDPFWEKSEAMFLMSLFYYVWKEYPKREQSFRKVMELLREARIPEDEEEETALDRKMAKLDEDHPARLAYDKVRRGAVDTVRSIFISANARLAFLQDEEGEIESLNVLEITPKEAIELDLASLNVKGEPGLAEVKRILEEYREVIEEKRKKEEKLDGEIREAEGKLINHGKEVLEEKTERETVEERIRKYPFSDEQLEEAMAGIENGLSEEAEMFTKKMTSIVVGTFAVMLLGGCGGALAAPDVDLVASPVISQEKPSQAPRIELDPFADFEVVYFEDKGSLPVILGGKDILQTNTGGENYGLSKEEKEAELEKQEADRDRYGERVICLVTGCSPKLAMKIIDTHEKKLPVTYVIHHLAKGRTNANEEDGGEVTVEARLEGADKNKYRLEKDSRNVKIEGVSRYVAYDPERPEEIEKIWKSLKASHEEQPITLFMGVLLDEWDAYTDTDAFLSGTYPELEIRSWEAVTPVGVIVRCDVKNWAKGPVDLENHYAVLDFYNSYHSIIEHADGSVAVERQPVSEGAIGYGLTLFSSEEKMTAHLAKRNINQDYILKISAAV